MTTISLLIATGLHARRPFYDALHLAVERHKPNVVALVGDFLGLSHAVRLQEVLAPAECAHALAAMPCRDIVFVRGKHEGANWKEFSATWQTSGRSLVVLNGEVHACGPFRIVGFSCRSADGQKAESAMGDFPSLLRRVSGSHTVVLLHGLPIGLAGSASPGTGPLQRFQPALVFETTRQPELHGGHFPLDETGFFPWPTPAPASALRISEGLFP